MADEKQDNPMDFEEPTDGGISAADPVVEPEVEEVEENNDWEEDNTEGEEEEGYEYESNEPEGAANLPLDVIEEAIGYGLTSSEIEGLGSEDNIAAVLAILDRKIESTADTSPSDSVYDDDDDPFADPDENTGVQNSEVAELRKQVKALEAAIKGQSERPDADKLFGLLDSDYDDLFGEVGGDLTKTHTRNRNKVLQELDTIKAGYKARKRAIPSNRRLFKQAVRSVFGEHESKVVKKKFSDSAKKRQSQFINRVNSRDARRPKDGRSSAIDSVKKFLADRGYNDLESVETFE